MARYSPFVGEPAAVIEAAGCAAAKARLRTIDMRQHKGEHPLGALASARWCRSPGDYGGCAALPTLAQRLADEVGLTIYCYKAPPAAAPPPRFGAQRRMQACRRNSPIPRGRGLRPGHLPRKPAPPPSAARLLLAYNVNLNTTSTRRANHRVRRAREGPHQTRRGPAHRRDPCAMPRGSRSGNRVA
ncbi:MAG: hypothetical protein R3E96_13725 [Planctomycetota bacterium]